MREKEDNIFFTLVVMALTSLAILTTIVYVGSMDGLFRQEALTTSIKYCQFVTACQFKSLCCAEATSTVPSFTIPRSTALDFERLIETLRLSAACDFTVEQINYLNRTACPKRFF